MQVTEESLPPDQRKEGWRDPLFNIIVLVPLVNYFWFGLVLVLLVLLFSSRSLEISSPNHTRLPSFVGEDD